MAYYIGVDIGTTHIKTGVFDNDGNIISLLKEETKTHNDNYGKIYLQKNIFEIVLEQITELKNKYKNIDGIAVTGMAEAGIMIDKETKKPLTEIIPWFDTRTVDISNNYLQEHKEINEKDIFNTTGLRNSFKYGVYKYLWSMEKLSDDFNKENTIWLSICDYIVFKLTGSIITEPTFAARTLLYDVKEKCWSKDLIQYFGLNIDQLPKVIKSGEVAGMYEGIPVAICGHDHLCCTYGLDIDDNTLANSMGTSETYISVENKIDEDELYDRGVVFGPFVEDNKYFIMANLLSSGGSIEWIRNSIQKESITYDEIKDMLQKNKEITNILYFPFLTGVGTPYFNSEISASFIGLKQKHNVNDLIKCVVEGISYQSKYIVENSFLSKKENIVCIGGATNCSPWIMIKSNVMNKDLTTTNIKEGTLFGAVKLMLDKGLNIKNNFNLNNYEEYKKDNIISNEYKKIYEEKYLKFLSLIEE